MAKIEFGRDRVRVTGYGVDGVRVRKTFTKKRQGTRYKALAEETYAGLIDITGSKGTAHSAQARQFRQMTVRELAKRYRYEHLAHTRVDLVSVDAKLEIGLHKWGAYRLCHVRRGPFRDWLWNLLCCPYTAKDGMERQYSAAYVKDVAKYMSAMFSWAEDIEIIPPNSNPCKLADIADNSSAGGRQLRKELRRRAPAPRPILGFEEFTDFIERLPQSIRRLAVACWCTGMRRGEACNLRWADIEADQIHVCAGGDKEAKRKTVFMERELHDLLTEIEIEQLANGGKSEHVFLDVNGSPMRPANFTRQWARYRRKQAEDTGNPKWLQVTVHSLRKSWTTRKHREGHDPKLISRNLGHATTRITEDVYNVADEDRMRELTGFYASGDGPLTAQLSVLVEEAQEKGTTLAEAQTQLRTLWRKAAQERRTRQRKATDAGNAWATAGNEDEKGRSA